MITLNKYKEILKLCTGTQNNKDVDGWETLKEFKHTWSNLAFNYKVYKKDNNIVIALAGTNLFSQNDLRNDWAIWNNNDYKHIPSQFGEAERLYNRVKLKYPKARIVFVGYTPKYNYTNIPQIDFNRNFPKTVMPQMMPITIMQPVNFSSAPSVYNNISLSGNTLNIPLAVTALDLLINILKNNRKY